MSEALAPFLLLAGALLVASLVSRPRLASAMIAIAGAVTGWLGWHAAGYMAIPVAALVVIVGLVQSLGGVIADGRAELSEDEESFASGPLAGLGRAEVRRFLDQGMWVSGRTGDVLTREGDPVGALTWLASGSAEVIAHGTQVGTVGPGQLVGEATILSTEPATATVRLTEDAHFWCAPAKALTAYLAAQPRTRAALERGFSISLKDKLRNMNRARAR